MSDAPIEITREEWKKIKAIIKAARVMVYDDPDYWENDYKEPEAKKLIKAIKEWDES